MSNNWKQYGGTKNLSKDNNITTHTLVCDNITLKSAYVGTFTIDGDLVVTNNGTFGKNVDISGNLTAESIQINTGLIFSDLLVNGNLEVEKNTTLKQEAHIYNKLYLGANSDSYFYGNATQEAIGINTTAPEATLDIVGNTTQVLNVYTNQPTNRNIIARNSNNHGIAVQTSDISSSIQFYNDTIITAAIPDGQIQYLSGGYMGIDASTNVQINSQLTVSNLSGQTAHIENETATIYDISAGKYLYNIYGNDTENTGNALTLVATDASSITFLNMITPLKTGLKIGGGAYPNDQTRSAGTLGFTNTNDTYVPIQNLVEGTNQVIKRATTGFNTYAPRTDDYTVDINGPTHITNGQITPTTDTTFQTIQTQFFGNRGMSCGTPSAISLPYFQNIVLTVDGGQSWTPVDIDSGNLRDAPQNFNSIFVYNNNYAFTGGTDGFFYYTYDGGINWRPITLVGYSSITIKSIYVVVSPISGSLRVFFLTDPTLLKPYNINYFDVATADLDGDEITQSVSAAINDVNFVSCNHIDGNGTYIYVAGKNSSNYDLISKYNLSVNLPSQTSNTPVAQYNYNAIYVYDDSTAIAVGTNSILWTTNGGSTWTNVATTDTLNSVFIYSSLIAVAVGTSGEFMYSADGFATWITVPTEMLNASGNATSLTQYDLTGITMMNINSFVITATVANYINGSQLGQSRQFYVYLPNLFNRQNNNVLDISGCVYVSGDMHINDGGAINSNNTFFSLINENVLNIQFGGNATNIDMGSTIGNTIVHNNLVIMGETTTVEDISLNGNIYVNKNININTGTTGQQGASSIAIGLQAGQTSQQVDSIAIGCQAGQIQQGSYAVAMGTNAGQQEQGVGAVAFGYRAGQTGQGSSSAAVGSYAGGFQQGQYAVAMGSNAGQFQQGLGAVSAGYNAGQTGQGVGAVATGQNAGQINQGLGGVAAGQNAGQFAQGSGAVAAGYNAGQTGQGVRAVAIGFQAGELNQGINTIAIGFRAGFQNQNPNSIVLNATDALLNAGNTGTFVNPIRQTTISGANMMAYDNVSKEIINLQQITTDLNGNLSISGNTFLTSATNSTALNTGALQITGGISIGGNAYVGGNVNVANTTQTNIALANTINPIGNTIGIGPGLSNTVNIGNYGNSNPAYSDTINIGGTYDFVNFYGNVTTSAVNNLLIKNKTITLNTGSLGYNSSFGSGITINDNSSNTLAGYFLVDASMNGYIFKAPNLTGTVTNGNIDNVVDLNINSLITPLNSALLMLQPSGSLHSDSNYVINPSSVDISNIVLRDAALSTTTNQYITTSIEIVGDLSTNQNITCGPQTFADNSVIVSATPALDYANFAKYWSSSLFSQYADSPNQTVLSATGQYQTIVSNSKIYCSSNYGNTWTSPLTVSTSTASAVAISSSGQYQLAVFDSANTIRLSSNYGQTWTSGAITVPAGSGTVSCCMSASGKYQYFFASNFAASGTNTFYYSSNFGSTWTTVSTTYNRAPAITITSLVSSASGKYVSFCMFGGGTTSEYIYNSSNYGVSFSAIATPNTSYYSLSMSASGKYVSALVCGTNGIVYYSSNFGTTFTAGTTLITDTGVRGRIAMSSSGQYQVAIKTAGTAAVQSMYYSTDYGVSWVSTTNTFTFTGYWKDVCISSSGQHMSLGYSNGTFVSAVPLLHTHWEGGNNMGIGFQAGQTGQQASALAFGFQAGQQNQGSGAIAIGFQAGQTEQQSYAVANGYGAGQLYQGTGSIAIGYQAGQNTQPENTISIGYQAGSFYQGSGSVATGFQAGSFYQGSGSVATGFQAGSFYQGSGSVAMGYQAGFTGQKDLAVAIGFQAGLSGQGTYSVAIGYLAGQFSQAANAIAIGKRAGLSGQGAGIAIGNDAGRDNQQSSAIAIGTGSGVYSQQSSTVAIGNAAGYNSQQYSAIAIGTLSGNNSQQDFAIGIGHSAGFTNQGINSVAIGYLAGYENQAASSIVLNASGTLLNAGNTGTFVNPIRQTMIAGSNLLAYDYSGTSEIIDISSLTLDTNGNLTISSNTIVLGNMAIGIADPTNTYNLDISGTARATSFNATSDYRIKANIQSLNDSFSVDYLRPVRYFNREANKDDIGFIAHEVQQFYPCLVTGEKDGNEKQSLNYNGLLGILVKDIQECKNEIKRLTQEVEMLKTKNMQTR